MGGWGQDAVNSRGEKLTNYTILQRGDYEPIGFRAGASGGMEGPVRAGVVPNRGLIGNEAK
jgi:hypothetical protein